MTTTAATTTDVLLVRHGEAHCNLAGVAGGDIGCTGLTDRGREQALRLRAELTRLHTARPFDAVYNAPRRRVQETTDLAAVGLGVPITVEPALSGPHHGVADGRPWAEIWAEFGSSPADQPDRPFAAGSESWNAFIDRASAALDGITNRHSGQRVLVVAHAETVEVAHTLFLRLPRGPALPVAFVVTHCSITWWSHRTPRSGPARWYLVAHNATGHLDPVS